MYSYLSSAKRERVLANTIPTAGTEGGPDGDGAGGRNRYGGLSGNIGIF